MSDKKVIVFGSIGIDLVTTVKDFPLPGQTIPGTSFKQVPGGKGANQALVCASLDYTNVGNAVHVFMAGAVGLDGFAQAACSGLESYDVNMAFVKKSGTITGVATIFVAENGQNSIAVVPGANALAEQHWIADYVLDNNIVLMQHECPIEENKLLAKRAKQNNALTILNAAPAYDLQKEDLEHVDILIVNESEALHLLSQHNLQKELTLETVNVSSAKALHEYFGCEVLLTLGSKGAVYYGNKLEGNAQKELMVSAPKVEVVDTTGAGDSFIGAFVYGLATNNSIGNSLKLGVAAGSLACTQEGAQNGLVYREVLELSKSLE